MDTVVLPSDFMEALGTRFAVATEGALEVRDSVEMQVLRNWSEGASFTGAMAND